MNTVNFFFTLWISLTPWQLWKKIQIVNFFLRNVNLYRSSRHNPNDPFSDISQRIYHSLGAFFIRYTITVYMWQMKWAKSWFSGGFWRSKLDFFIDSNFNACLAHLVQRILPSKSLNDYIFYDFFCWSILIYFTKK
jgi:hypothetical protein